MLSRKAELLSLGVVLVFALVVLHASWALSYPNSKIMPLFIDGLLIGLVFLGLLRALRRPRFAAAPRRSETREEECPEERPESEEPPEAMGLAACVFYFAGYGAGIWILGFYAASFLFVLSYVRLNCGRWREAVTAAILCVAVLPVFPWLLEVDLYLGLLYELWR